MSIRQNDFAHTFGPLFLFTAELQVGSGRHAVAVTSRHLASEVPLQRNSFSAVSDCVAIAQVADRTH